MARRTKRRREPTSQSLFRLAEQAGLSDDPQVQKLLNIAVATDNPHLKREVEKALTAKAVHQQRQPFDDPPPSDPDEEGRIALGGTHTGDRYYLQQDALVQHLLAVGQSGSGKTTLFYNMMEQLAVPFWSFDLKQDYRHLVQREELDLVVVPWRELRFNPLQPPEGVAPRRWAQVVSEIFGHATSLLSGSKNYLLRQIIELYQLYDLFEQVTGPFPSLHELQVLMDREKINYVRKAANYRDTVVNRLEAMNLAAGTIFDCSEGYPLEDFLDRNVVFEFDGLARDVQNFVMELLFAYVYEYRVAQNQRDQGLQHVFFLDEGKRVFSVYKERQDASGIPEIDALTAKMREFGEGLVVADQEASKLTDSIKANTSTKILLAAGDAKQFQEMMRSMDLSEQQAEFAQRVGVGEAVVQAGNTEPVPVDLDNVDVAKDISDGDLRKLQGQLWNQLSYEPRETAPAFRHRLGYHDSEDEQPEIPEDPDHDVELSDDARRLLEDVVENPFKSVTERYEDLFSSRGKGDAPKKELVDRGLVVERGVRVPGHQRKLLQLTTRGREVVEHQFEVAVERKGRGGIVHQFWQKQVKEVMEELGWTAKREMYDADVYVNMSDVELAIEIAMGNNEREITHIEDHLDRDFLVWLACRNKELKSKLRDRLRDTPHVSEDDVVFKLLTDIVDVDPDSLDL